VKTPVITQTRYEVIALKYVYPDQDKEIRMTLRNETEPHQIREDVFAFSICPGCEVEEKFLRGETVFLTIVKTGRIEEIIAVN
jgi:hypothetical protein